MELKVIRKWKKISYTIGDLYVNGKWFCNTLEDKDRGLNDNMSVEEIKLIKIQNQTAIPTGRYKVSLDFVSPKFSTYLFYNSVCNGRVPRLLNVKGYTGILIHVGDGPKALDLTAGCVLVGLNKVKGLLLNGKEIFKLLYSKLKDANDKGEDIYITIE